MSKFNKRMVSTRGSRRADDILLLDADTQDIEFSNHRALSHLSTQRQQQNRIDRIKLYTLSYLSLRAKHQPSQQSSPHPNPQSLSHFLPMTPPSVPINDLRNERHSEQLRQQQISNRIRYFNEQTQKNLRKAEWARKKYNIMVEQRNTNLRMRENIKENLSLIKNQSQEYAKSAQSRTESQRRHRKDYLKKFQTARRDEATPVREMSKRNSITIYQAKLGLEEINRRKASSVKEKEFYLTVKLSKRDQKRKMMAKTNHFVKILEEIERKKEVLAKNQSLMEKLNKMSNGVRRASLQAQEELQKLEKLVGAKSRKSLKTQRSFFTTNKLEVS